MELPFSVRMYIENEINNININSLKIESEKISNNYRKKNRNGKSLLKEQNEAIAYAITRMPATYGAVSKSIEKLIEIYTPNITTVADIGAGTGSVGIAVNELLDVKEIECFEREENMIDIGKLILSNYSEGSSKIKWTKLDITQDQINNEYDMVISAYMINELNEKDINNVIEKMWNISKDIILIVEPGTVQGYKNIMKVKDKLVEMGGNIIAPCISKKCNLQQNDWCNFYSRVQRTKIHKKLKSGDLPYEDEKFIYIAISKKEKIINNKSRIIRHPLLYNGYIKLKICTDKGIEELIISKKEKERFQHAKKLNHGDMIKM